MELTYIDPVIKTSWTVKRLQEGSPNLESLEFMITFGEFKGNHWCQ